LGPQSGSDSRPPLATEPKRAPLARLFLALRQEKIPFLIIGMTAAVLQGVPVVTADVDLWIGSPRREHDRVLQLCHRLGADIQDDYVAELPDGSQLNFAYEVAGLKSFRQEKRRARRLRWLGVWVSVLSLEQIQRSKTALQRPKDKAHLIYLDQALKLRRRLQDS